MLTIGRKAATSSVPSTRMVVDKGFQIGTDRKAGNGGGERPAGGFSVRLTNLSLAVVLFFLLGCADEVLAWGPATHVSLATEVLANLSLLPAAVAAVLARHKLAYRYGNIAADVVFAKRWSRVKQFCHHWSTAFRVHDAAADEKAKAFAYGYLSHLAADTVAHGKYVPRQIVISRSSVNFGHFYWEMRADAAQADASWSLLQRTLRRDHAHHHRELERHITDTFLPYELNRMFFESMNALAVRQTFRRTVSAWHRYSRIELPSGLMDGYRAECLDRIYQILSQGARSALLREDPNGTSALMQLRVRRREERRLKRRGLPVERRLLEASVGLAPKPAIGRSLVDTPAADQSESEQLSGGVLTQD